MSLLQDNLGNIIVGAAVAAILIIAVISIIRRRRSGKGSCSCGCGACPVSSTCHSKDKEIKQ